jgi:hypothetical protein
MLLALTDNYTIVTEVGVPLRAMLAGSVAESVGARICIAGRKAPNRLVKGRGWATLRRPSSLARVRPVCVSGRRALSMRLGRANARAVAVATRVLRSHRGRYPVP